MYYRYINEFYLQLSHLIYDKVQQRPGSRRNFFTLRNDHEDQSLINEPSLKFIRSLEEYFIEGLLLDFSPLAMSNRDQCQIPLYRVEDRILNINKNQAVKIGQLVYDFSQAQWLLEKD
ncbi:hypothetical protein AWM75_03910 [Aerococcus urinaehominis]|uniref:Uncharacterized protein n=1 Tax=Aerococcus urinaehominis TaxID=128944 RepID=A0A109RGY5_9LACT|nr:hypothetical protein [Aerococcus urinaehominis]AMB99201.1 hypothetical protein AWM75_03910 [Aerococcus urinaehominis]SDM32558.1 hypothetical protein SAMN04487985_11256 [Aerococcus urinaehominis]